MAVRSTCTATPEFIAASPRSTEAVTQDLQRLSRSGFCWRRARQNDIIEWHDRVAVHRAMAAVKETTMKFGIHLPHAGEQATPALIRRHAERAEALGLEDVWVSEHIIVPRDKFPRSPLFFDPVLSLTWAAAATKRVRLGTSVLVLPMRHPLPLAKELATLHNFSEGRLILGAGAGWLEAEFAALGVPFNERGRRLDEGLAMMRAVWTEDPVTLRSRHIPAVIEGMTMTPHPISAIPLWFGGSSDAALRRTIRMGDGWHGSGHTAVQAAPMVKQLRDARPEAAFTMSMRVQWDGRDRGALRELVDSYAAIGIDHLLIAPQDTECGRLGRSH